MEAEAVVAEPYVLKGRLLGPVEITVGTRVLGKSEWVGRKPRSLLVLLLSSPGFHLHREQVLDLLWPELDLAAGANALYKAMHSLRRVLEPDIRQGRASRFLEARGDAIGVAATVQVWTDLTHASALLAEAERANEQERRLLLRQVLALYRGEFVADDPYADWAFNRREALKVQLQTATLALATLDIKAGEPLSSVPYLESLLTNDPTSEPIHRALMNAFAVAGQRSLALSQFERCREALLQEFDEEPDPDTVRLAHLIRERGVSADIEIPTRVAALRRGSIPSLPTRTIGRDEEIECLGRKLVEPDTRLLTIVGMGGVGKTRLAIAAGHRVEKEFLDGAGFVSLAPVTNPDMLFDAVARALGLNETPGKPARDIVHEYLGVRNYLLVLDNLEQITEIAGDLAALLEACEGLTVLATSRIPLRIRAEQVFHLDSLDVPQVSVADPIAIQANPSVQLFLQSMVASGVRQDDASANATLVAEICRLLDGLPLAIELAGARCFDLGPNAILVQLQRRQRSTVLTDGPRDVPDRHQTLRNLVTWSYNLLPPPQQRLFRQLAVFVGGVELDALESMAGPDGQSLANALAEASLVQWVQVNNDRRLLMLETIREVACSLLDERGERAAVEGQWIRYYRETSKDHQFLAAFSSKRNWYDRIGRDIDNVRAVLSRCVTDPSPDASSAMAILVATSWFWMKSGLAREALDWNLLAFQHSGQTVSRDSAYVAFTIAHLSEQLGNAEQFDAFTNVVQSQMQATDHPDRIFATAWLNTIRLQNQGRFEESIALNLAALEQIDPACTRQTANWINLNSANANSLWHLGKLPAALDAFLDSLRLVREIGDFGGEAAIHWNLGEIYLEMGDVDRAESALAEAQRLALLAGNRNLLPNIAGLRAGTALARGDFGAALRHNAEAINLNVEGGHLREAAMQKLERGVIQLQAGTVEGVRSTFADAVSALLEVGEGDDVMSCACEVGLMSLAMGDAGTACTLLSAAITLAADNCWSFSASQTPRLEQGIAQARESAGEHAERCWERGKTMTPGQILMLAADACSDSHERARTHGAQVNRLHELSA